MHPNPYPGNPGGPLSDDDVPAAYRITIPWPVVVDLADLYRADQLAVADTCTAAARTLRTRPPAPADACYVISTCTITTTTDRIRNTPICVLCAIDIHIGRRSASTWAMNRLNPDTVHDAQANVTAVGSHTKHAVTRILDANPVNGGHVHVLEFLAHHLTAGTMLTATTWPTRTPTTRETR